MILTGGRFRGRRISAPPGHRVRPTPARVKEALFSILAPRIEGTSVLDLFAGSGALGLEALSRGAASVVFIEADVRTAAALKTTLMTFGLEKDEAQVHTFKAELAARRVSGKFNLVFADPPYAMPAPVNIFLELSEHGLLADDALIIYEHAAKSTEFDPSPFIVHRREVWGEVGMSFLTL